jgi:methyl-accepting chemotaxis protein
MRKLFIPVIALMNRLKYPQKFGLIGALCLIPIIVMMILLLTEIDKNITFAENERSGVEYYKPLKDLLVGVQLHRGMANNYLNGDASFKEKMTNQQSQIEEIIKAVNEVDRHYGETLKTTEKWNALKEQWQGIHVKAFSMQSKESLELHTALVENMIALISHIGDTSSLILDPELDSYYLMDSIVNKLPLLSEKIGQARALGSSIATRKKMINDEKEQLIALSVHTKTTFDATNTGVDIAIRENPSIKPKVEAYVKEYSDSVNGFMDVLNKKLITAQLIDIKPDEYFALASKAITDNFKLFDSEAEVLVDLLQTREKKYAAKKYTTLTITGVITILLLYLFIAFYLSVKRTVSILEHSTKLMANGDLTIRVELETRDELRLVGTSFNTMVESFRQMVTSNKRLAEQVAVSANQLTTIADESEKVTNEIAAMNQKVANGAENQARGAEECSRAMEEMAIGIQKIAESSGVVSELSSEMLKQAEYGNGSIQDAVVQTSALHDSTNKAAFMIQELDKLTQRIGQIATVITDISMQTNLLALNANIEAARAGEHGRGFTVVANEIRKLAEQSKESAREISGMIQEIQQYTAETVCAMNEGAQEVAKGIHAIHKTGEAFGIILSAVQDVAEQIEEVSATSQQMAAGSEQVSASIDGVSSIAQQSAAIARNVASASEEQISSVENISSSTHTLSQMAQELRELVERFKV